MDTRCPNCWCFDEDGGHRFLKCKAVMACWRELQLENIRLKLLEAQSAIEFVTVVLALDANICLKVSFSCGNCGMQGTKRMSVKGVCQAKSYGAVVCTLTDIQAEGEKKLQP